MTDYDEKNVTVNKEQTYLNPYETDSLVNAYVAFHYGERIKILGREMPNFAAVCALIVE